MNAEIKIRKAFNGYIGTDAQGREHLIPKDLEALFHWILWELERRGPLERGDKYGTVVVITEKDTG